MRSLSWNQGYKYCQGVPVLLFDITGIARERVMLFLLLGHNRTYS